MQARTHQAIQVHSICNQVHTTLFRGSSCQLLPSSDQFCSMKDARSHSKARGHVWWEGHRDSLSRRSLYVCGTHGKVKFCCPCHHDVTEVFTGPHGYIGSHAC